MSFFRILFALFILMARGWAVTPATPPAKDAAWTGEPQGSSNSKMETAPPAPATNPPPVAPTPPLVPPTSAPPAVTAPAPSPSLSASTNHPDDRIATLDPEDLKEYDSCSDAVKQLISQGLALTKLGLSYRYGSSDPKSGGMDCSGTIYYLLKQSGLHDVPRDASGMYKWVWKESRFQAVVSSNPDTFELDSLQPGDLLFWTGTYEVNRDPPVTHVMLYLGHNRHNGHRVMMGASEGRTYEGHSRYGVSVFDFTLPRPAAATDKNQPRFIGYGAVPGLEKAYSSGTP